MFLMFFIGMTVALIVILSAILLVGIARNLKRFKRPKYFARDDEIAWAIAMCMSHRIWLYAKHDFLCWIDWDLGLIESTKSKYPLLTGDMIFTLKQWGGYWVSVVVKPYQAILIGTYDGKIHPIRTKQVVSAS